jgi:hypothetical protein
MAEPALPLALRNFELVFFLYQVNEIAQVKRIESCARD